MREHTTHPIYRADMPPVHKPGKKRGVRTQEGTDEETPFFPGMEPQIRHPRLDLSHQPAGSIAAPKGKKVYDKGLPPEND